jgi:Zn-dependent peptidase ImmA (M78 family)/DNA-binding XRE family transcriptional regulator
MASISSDANPRMLEWARESAGYSQESAADSLKIETKELADWESGRRSPSFAVLRQLATRYKRPLLVFYLPEPPSNFTVVKDFRVLSGSISTDFSTELRRAIANAQERQEWAASYLEDLGADRCSLVSSVSQLANVQSVAENLRQQLEVTLGEQVGCQYDYSAFGLWKRKIEKLGVFVFQASKISVDEMRGFALPNPFAPVVVVNGADSYTAKSFTLIHELVHILLGVSAVYNGRTVANEPQSKIERFCNRVTGEVLIPRNDFIPRWPSNWKANDDSLISASAKRYHVSRLVIALRLVETGLADTDYLSGKWPLLQSYQKKRDGGAAIAQDKLTAARVGESFARLALSAYYANEIHGAGLTELLGMKLKHLPQLESRIYPNRVQTLLQAE